MQHRIRPRRKPRITQPHTQPTNTTSTPIKQLVATLRLKPRTTSRTHTSPRTTKRTTRPPHTVIMPPTQTLATHTLATTGNRTQPKQHAPLMHVIPRMSVMLRTNGTLTTLTTSVNTLRMRLLRMMKLTQHPKILQRIIIRRTILGTHLMINLIARSQTQPGQTGTPISNRPLATPAITLAHQTTHTRPIRIEPFLTTRTRPRHDKPPSTQAQGKENRETPLRIRCNDNEDSRKNQSHPSQSTTGYDEQYSSYSSGAFQQPVSPTRFTKRFTRRFTYPFHLPFHPAFHLTPRKPLWQNGCNG